MNNIELKQTRSYSCIWILNCPIELRGELIELMHPREVRFPSIREEAESLIRRIDAEENSLLLVWRPGDLDREHLVALFEAVDAAILGPALVRAQIGSKTRALGYQINAWPQHHDKPSLFTRERIDAVKADSERLAAAEQSLTSLKDSNAAFFARGTGLVKKSTFFADAADGQERILLVGDSKTKSARREAILCEQALMLRDEHPDAFIVVLPNTHMLSFLSENRLRESADSVVIMPWHPIHGQDADLIASSEAPLCLENWLRDRKVRLLGDNPLGVPLDGDKDNKTAAWAILEDALFLRSDSSQITQAITLSEALPFLERTMKLEAVDDRFAERELQIALRDLPTSAPTLDVKVLYTALESRLNNACSPLMLWRSIASLYAEHQQYENALTALEHALAEDPNDSFCYDLRGRMRARLGDMSEKVGQDYYRAFELSGEKNLDLLERYFNFEWERSPVNEVILGKYQKAISKHGKTSLKKSPSGRGLLSQFAAMQLEAGLFDASIRTLKAALTRGENPASYARMHDRVGQRAGMKPIPQARKLALHHLEHNESMFRTMLDLADGDIAIVGNGPQELGRGRGAEIDSHGMVVRFNTYSTSFPQSHDYGTKTDLWVRMPPTGYVKTAEDNYCQNIIITGSNRLNRSSGIWEWISFLLKNGHQVGCVPKEPFYELTAKLGKVPTAGLAMAYMLYQETGPVDPARIFGCSFAEDEPTQDAIYHHSDQNAAMGSRHNFDVERAFFQTIRKTDQTKYYLPGVRRALERDVPTLSVKSPEGERRIWTIANQGARYDRILSATAGLTGYTLFGKEVEVLTRKELNAALATPHGLMTFDAKTFPVLSKGIDRKRTLVLGFGLGPTGQLGQRLAAHLGMEYMSVEYGLISSCHLPSEKQFNFSLMLDDLGAFFDTEHRSRLEMLLDEGFGTQTNALLGRARALRETILAHNITKYNNAPAMALQPRAPGKRRILVIDQTSGDLSIRYGQCETYSFQDMLDHALAQDNAEVILKPHPETLAGAKGANFDIDALRKRKDLTILAENCNIMSLMSQVDEVYVMVSGVGFEALMAGKTVRCFGVPFYAGRGLTVDMVEPSRPRRPVSIEELIAGVFLQYHLWFDPSSGEPTTAEACLERLIPSLPSDRGLFHDGTHSFEADFTNSNEKRLFEALKSGQTPPEISLAQTLVQPGDNVANISDGSGLISLCLSDLGLHRVYAITQNQEALERMNALDHPGIAPVLASTSTKQIDDDDDDGTLPWLEPLLEDETLSLLRVSVSRGTIDMLKAANELFSSKTAPAHILCHITKREMHQVRQFLKSWYDEPQEIQMAQSEYELHDAPERRSEQGEDMSAPISLLFKRKETSRNRTTTRRAKTA